MKESDRPIQISIQIFKFWQNVDIKDSFSLVYKLWKRAKRTVLLIIFRWNVKIGDGIINFVNEKGNCACIKYKPT